MGNWLARARARLFGRTSRRDDNARALKQLKRIRRVVPIATAMLISGCDLHGEARDLRVSSSPSANARSARVKNLVLRDIDSLAVTIDRLTLAFDSASFRQRRDSELQGEFRAARVAYKRVEFIAEYHAPEIARLMNGPALPEVEEDDGPSVVRPPEGFQVLEELLFPEVRRSDHSAIAREISILSTYVRRLRESLGATTFTDATVLDAVRIEVIRLTTLGLAGFDSPIARFELGEMASALRGVSDGVAPYIDDLAAMNPSLSAALADSLRGATAVLAAAPDADGFDRLNATVAYLNPVARTLARASNALAIPAPQERRAVRATSSTVYDRDAFDPSFFAPPYAERTTPELVALGRRLFFDPVLSGNENRSCASCHQPERAFSDGLARSAALDGASRLRNAPTIINSGLQYGSFADLRTAYLEDQVTTVLENRAEMHGSVDVAARRLVLTPGYVRLFREAFAGSSDSVVTGLRLRVALAAYMRSLTALDSRFDRYVRGDSVALSDVERRGFNIFMGKGRCGTCHFAPLFNGTVPPQYTRTDVEVLGVPVRPATRRATIDPDLGRFAMTRAEPHRFAFKTPTVRNAALTAPYMHNGVYRSLEEVVDFYDRGGGAGIGIELAHQTLPATPLRLTRGEKRELVAFLEALNDTTGTMARPGRQGNSPVASRARHVAATP